MHVIIAGSRDFNDYELLKTYCDSMLVNTKDVQIISGGARGADTLGERYAKERGYNIILFPAPWDDIANRPKNEIKFRRDGTPYWVKAGYHRNKIMAQNADALIAFWDGISGGTKNMIDNARKYKLLIRIKNI